MSATEPAFPPLCTADRGTFWPWYSWTDLARWPEPALTTVVIPVTGLADWELDLPLDAEEALALGLLKKAAAEPALPAGRLLVLPPLRFVLGPSDRCAFPVTPELAHAALEDLVLSVKASGFTRIVFYNSSPWNEELVDAAARDLRIAHGVQMFIVNLAALGLDLAPWRSRDESTLRTAWAETTASAGATPLLDKASRCLAGLLREIADRPPLPNHGEIRRVRP